MFISTSITLPSLPGLTKPRTGKNNNAIKQEYFIVLIRVIDLTWQTFADYFCAGITGVSTTTSAFCARLRKK